MAIIRKEKVNAICSRAYALIDYNNQNNLEKQCEFLKQTVLADKSLTKDEKSYAIERLNKNFDCYKILYNVGTKRICENCQVECLATLYCEHCVRNYLKTKFSNWTSGNINIDNLIQKCQMETLQPDMIVEWIPYNNLQNIKYLTKGGCSEIYTAVWIDGGYEEWDNEEKKLKRFGGQRVVLKKLENVESANRSWFEEGKSHLTISSKYGQIVTCYGITKDPSDGNYMLVMNKLHKNLREYLQQNKLTWNDRIQITDNIVFAISRIHRENAIHRDLHSGNILFNQIGQVFVISDLGFCGPADKPLNSIYGNLPYIAPEVIAGKETTFASDVYSIGMLMWEISSGQPPFINKHNYDLAIKIVNGMRPRIIPGTPLEYKELMERCWDADPTKRPDIYTLTEKINDLLRRLYFQNENKQQINNNSNFNNSQLNLNFSNISSISTNFSISTRSTDSFFGNFSSRVYNFKGLPEPRNATREEQEAYHSLELDFDLQNDLIIENETKTQIKRIYFNDDEKDSTFNSKKVKLNNDEEYINNENEYNYMQRSYTTINDENINSEEQDKMDLNYLLN